jgi:hypothetical protein
MLLTTTTTTTKDLPQLPISLTPSVTHRRIEYQIHRLGRDRGLGSIRQHLGINPIEELIIQIPG